MRNWSILSLIALIVLVSCEEEPPPGLDFNPPPLMDTSYIITTIPAAQGKNVLIEDITGVSCNNCPNAATKAKELTTKYPRVRALALYFFSNSLTAPHKGYEDLRTQEAEDIVVDTELPTGIPVGFVNRAEVNSTKVAFSRDWENIITQQLVKTTPVNIEIESSYDVKDSMLTTTVKLTYTDAVSEKHKLAVLLNESYIKGMQTMPDNTKNPDYIHNHVLRTGITAALGSLLNEDLSKGRVFEKSFQTKIKGHWVIDELEIVALVQDADSKEIVHVETAKVQ